MVSKLVPNLGFLTWCGLGQNTKGVLSFSPTFGKKLRSKTENRLFGHLCGEKRDKSDGRKSFFGVFLHKLMKMQILRVWDTRDARGEVSSRRNGEGIMSLGRDDYRLLNKRGCRLRIRRICQSFSRLKSQ